MGKRKLHRTLTLSGEIEEVLPLDDANLLEKAKPISPDGQVKVDQDRFTARHDAQVKAVLAHGPFALIVLGGGHDLAESVRRLSGGSCEYLRITTRRYGEVAREP